MFEEAGPRIIDTHAHLDQIPDIDRVLREALNTGVEAVAAVSVDLASMKAHTALSARVTAPKIFLGLGIHPGNILDEELAPALQFIREHAPQAAAIGEVGLDYWYQDVRKDDGKKRRQQEVFSRQLDLAREFSLPVVVHSRGAWAEALEMVRSAGVKQAVFHWYTGPRDVLRDILNGGYLISASPALAYSSYLREAVTYAPVEQTLIETDTPVFIREGEGFAAEPKDVRRTLAAYSLLKSIPPEQAADQLNRNARAFFRDVASS